ncbi:hypothetical protein Naga_101144g2 [Nannochloropsis gaditana]|uniref:Uncharacterized protein n=1 Tax=Nannochloropsis gaditana TaxID=72520 RepID=W7TSL3_9STRA|nr:hypothetical protein Naga_101144g2 [Nannochloropsis gaditana]
MLPSSTTTSSSGKYEDRIGNDTETSSTRELTIQNSNSSNSLDQTTSRLSSPSASTSSSVSGASLGWKLDWEHRYGVATVDLGLALPLVFPSPSPAPPAHDARAEAIADDQEEDDRGMEDPETTPPVQTLACRP